MRTTIDIDEDILQAAKELAKRKGTTTGRVISELARLGLTRPTRTELRNGVPVLPSRGEVVTLEKVESLGDEEGV
jgi:hypothetical protein